MDDSTETSLGRTSLLNRWPGRSIAAVAPMRQHVFGCIKPFLCVASEISSKATAFQIVFFVRHGQSRWNAAQAFPCVLKFCMVACSSQVGTPRYIWSMLLSHATPVFPGEPIATRYGVGECHGLGSASYSILPQLLCLFVLPVCTIESWGHSSSVISCRTKCKIHGS